MTTHQILQGGFFNDTLRTWQSRTAQLNPDCLIYPLFISYVKDAFEEISSLPGQYRVGCDKLQEYLQPMVDSGLKTVLLFGIINTNYKDLQGRCVYSEFNPVHDAVKLLRKCFPGLSIACDVCLCGYTSHGHCGVLRQDGFIDNEESISIIAKAALQYVNSGCHIVAPSDCMDGRIQSISDALKNVHKRNQVAIMSYSSKFSSCFYGPFRDAAGSSPSFGDRSNYQLPPGSIALAKRATSRDVHEEADILMVKPGMPYLDVVKEVKLMFPSHPLAIYQVSGEYAMLYHASKNGAFDLKKAVIESIQCMHRAGADVIISYFTPAILKWLNE